MNTISTRMAMFAVAFALMVPQAGQAELKKDQTYYTKANIWFENPEKVYSTNYHVGEMIPANSEVEMLGYGRGKATFKVKNTGVTITFFHIKKHSSISADEFFGRYFSETDISKELEKFTKLEQDAIKTGTVAVGMDKDAVFAAYGNPPSHRTASLDRNRWIYWKNRFATTAVNFVDGKVSSVE